VFWLHKIPVDVRAAEVFTKIGSCSRLCLVVRSDEARTARCRLELAIDGMFISAEMAQ